MMKRTCILFLVFSLLIGLTSDMILAIDLDNGIDADTQFDTEFIDALDREAEENQEGNTPEELEDDAFEPESVIAASGTMTFEDAEGAVFSVYDPQPEGIEDVQAAIDAFEMLPWYEAVKPHWQYEVDIGFIPIGYHCEFVDWDSDFGAAYYTFFPNAVAMAITDLVDHSRDGLQLAINNAASGDTITITNHIQFSGAPIIISKEITIQSKIGTQQTLRQTENFTRHFVITNGGNLILENITLDGNDTGGGVEVQDGGSFVLNTATTIEHCMHTDISSNIGGGVVIQAGGSFIMNDGLITNNQAIFGGGVYSFGFAEIRGGDISANNANVSGGGIYVDTTDPLVLNDQLVISGGAIFNNTAIDGGGIYSVGGVDFNGGEISGNITSFGDGGGIYNKGKITINGGKISGNTGGRVGGGIYNIGEAILTDVEIYNNTADSGGGIYNSISAGSDTYIGSLTVGAGVSIKENKAIPNAHGSSQGQGGGIWSQSTFLIDGAAEISENQASNGGGIFFEKNTVAFSLALDTTYTISGASVTKNTATLGGGIFVYDGNNVNICGGTEISDNVSVWGGGGIYTSGANEIRIYGGTKMNRNKSDFSGGGLCSYSTSSIYVYGGAEISGNTVTEDGMGGGGIYTSKSSIEIYGGGTTITDNKAPDNTGGGLYTSESVVDIYDGAKIDNNSARRGGGINFTDCEVEIYGQGTIVSNNIAEDIGGGVLCGSGPDSKLIVRDGAVIDKNEGFNGGGISSTPALPGSVTITISGATVSNNKSLGVSDGGGGGIYAPIGDIILENGAVISGNKAVNANGGGIYSKGANSLKFFQCEIMNNNAVNGGGLYIEDSDVSIDSGDIPENASTIIQNNTATNNGGGIYLYEDAFLDVYCVYGRKAIIQHNKAGSNGGGIYLSSGAGARLDGTCEIQSNQAVLGNGGGIYTEVLNYLNLEIVTRIIFGGNTAPKHYAPPDNAVTLWPHINTTSSTRYSHPVNNVDINVFTFTVTFDTGGGSAVASRTVAYATKVAKPSVDPTKPGFSFDEWYKDTAFSNVWDFTLDVVTEDITLYAKWLDHVLSVSIPVKLLWAAFDGHDSVESPDYYIINHSELPLEVSGKLSDTIADYNGAGIDLVGGNPNENELRLDIISAFNFQGSPAVDNPFTISAQGLLINDVPHTFGILGGTIIDEVSSVRYGTTGWFRIGGKYGGPQPATALRPVYGMEFSFETIH